jgi:hypothetical protein
VNDRQDVHLSVGSVNLIDNDVRVLDELARTGIETRTTHVGQTVYLKEINPITNPRYDIRLSLAIHVKI